MKTKGHFVYIILTQDDKYYCGYTDDIEKRFLAHQSGVGAKYTRAHKPLKIVYSKEFDTKSDAMKEEYRIKNLKRADKIKLINL